MNKENYTNIIDFGSNKIRISVFDNELNEKFFETCKVLIDENFSNHLDVVTKIIKSAEKKISSHIQDIILTLDSKDLFTIDISLKKNLDENLNLRKLYDTLVLELNRLIDSYYNQYQILHVLLDNCIIDNKHYDDLPKDIKKAKNIKIDFKIICFKKKNLELIKKGFNKCNLNIKNIFCTSYIKSFTYSNKLGLNKASFLEIGWERSSLMIFENNKLKFIQTIPIGSFHITKDISKIFNISIFEAEKIKKSFNRTDTEFSYENNFDNDHINFGDLIKKNISIDKLKKVILFRIQEIMDLAFRSLKNYSFKQGLIDTELFLIGEGSLLFNNNSFHINDKFNLRSINFYNETDNQICNSVLIYYLNNYQLSKKTTKNQGLFEKFFNLFSK